MRVVLAMSGGVDSSVSAYLLKQAGHEVVGLFMRSGATETTVCTTVDAAVTAPTKETSEQPSRESAGVRPSTAGQPLAQADSHAKSARKQGCCSAADAADARRAADMLDIPFHALDFHDSFRPILDYFADEYLAGRTPNPCIMCNNWLKFGRLWDFAREIGAERIATGHYAQIQPAADRSDLELVRGRDRAKDQSYVLFGIRRALLSRIAFPVGKFAKAEIRAIATRIGLRVADKPDSQEICFIPDNDYAAFIQRHRGKSQTAGEIVDATGCVVGHHDGYERFTIGQRKGLGVAFGTPRFVLAIEPDRKRVVVGTRDELARQTLEADRLNWLVKDVSFPLDCHAQIRYQHTAASAVAELAEPDRLRVTFRTPQFGIAPGQAVVLYDGPRVVGGGWIRSTR